MRLDDLLDKRDLVLEFMGRHPAWDIEAVVEQFGLHREMILKGDYTVIDVYASAIGDIHVATVWKRNTGLMIN